MRFRRCVLCCLGSSAAATLLIWIGEMPERWKKQGPQSTVKQITRNRFAANYGNLPLVFEANQGQTDRQVTFLSRAGGYTLFLTSAEAVLTLRPPGEA